MTRLSRPLNKKAVRSADNKFYGNHPELVKDGKRVPLSKDQTSLQNEWRQLYINHGGKIEPEKHLPDKKPKDVVHACPTAKLSPEVECYANGIQVQGSEDFRKNTKAALDRLNATTTGKSTLESIGQSGKVVTIVETTDQNGYSMNFTDEANRKPDGAAGKGSDSTIAFNPSFTPNDLPNEVVFGHELIHAQHKAYGVRETGTTGGNKNEELLTVGLPPYPESGMTENSLRDDLGLAKRTSY